MGQRAAPAVVFYSYTTGAAGFVRKITSTAVDEHQRDERQPHWSGRAPDAIDGHFYAAHWTADPEL